MRGLFAPPIIPTMLQAPKPKPKFTWWDITLGILNANVLAAFLISLVIAATNPVAGYFGSAATVLIPLLMGFLAGATWRKLELSVGQTALFAFLNSLAAVACAFFFLREGVVCLVMAFPLLYALIWAGTGLGIVLCRPRGGNRPAAVSVVPVLLAMVVYDCVQPKHEEVRVVTTSVTVHASAARVFPHMVQFSRITASPTFFLNKVGLPYPVETTAEGAFVGAERVCRFSDNVIIGERITGIIPDQTVAFTITEQPTYPEFTLHGRLAKGEMTVHDNGNGTATLTGTSWYTLRVHPLWYFGVWGDEVIHAVHGRVFAHIRSLSENAGVVTHR